MATNEGRVRTRSTGLGGITNLAVMAPIRTGMVASFEPISYLKRIEKVLAALQDSRRNLRESELLPSFFPDTVGRFSMFHNFRYDLVPPVREDEPWHLRLNVTFDGGWEPYMRVVYRDIGPLLDLLFCHNDTYPSSDSTFEEYCDWVRKNETGGGIFYVDSDMSLGDQRYLAKVEKAVRAGASELEVAKLALPPSSARQHDEDIAAAKKHPVAIVLPLRTLKGLYRLGAYFPPAEMHILRRFAQYVLKDSMEIMRWLDGLPAPDPADQTAVAWHKLWAEARFGMADELAWLEYGKPFEREEPKRKDIDPDLLQAHILVQDQTVTHGCLVLLRVENDATALAHLSELSKRCGPVPAGGIGYTIAFTYPGLKKLGISQSQLDTFPQEFVEGMEARCGILGDVRGNHPDRWRLPRMHGADGQVDMKTVHVCILLRRADAVTTAEEHPEFDDEIKNLNASAASGLRVLATQFTRSYRKGHFKFADGISQPEFPLKDKPKTPGAVYDNNVRAGELLAGYDTGRGDHAVDLQGLLKDGSFLVARKLRQRVDNLEKILATRTETEAEALAAKMMGRRYDGTPLANTALGANGNDFDHQSTAGDGCPFHAHTRRANPRDGRSYTPRILRRGMSYGPPRPEAGESEATLKDTDRGVVFMAYCASIAEQFETIQRWLVGGNSSGVGSAQPDPLLHVPQLGDPCMFRYIDDGGQLQRVSLGQEPLVELQWGLYLFVPALEALAKLKEFCVEPPAIPPPVDTPEVDPLERMRRKLEDPDDAKKEWEKIRSQPSGTQKTAYGELVGRHGEILDIMREPGAQYSVAEYGARKKLSVGLNLLGMDHANQHNELPTNLAILGITEEAAFKGALDAATRVLAKFPPLPGTQRYPIDLVNYSDGILGGLCRGLIGLPDVAEEFLKIGGRMEANPTPARCPGNLSTASRYIFTPHPRAGVETEGQLQGQAFRTQVEKWLKSANPQLGPLAKAVRAGLAASGAITEPAVGPGAGDAAVETLARNLAGVMVGFAPTVQGNFLAIMKNWIEDEALWINQGSLFEQSKGELTYADADKALRNVLFDTMRKSPVPGMLHRSRVGAADVPENRVVLGIASAMTDPAAPDGLLFGRDRSRLPTSRNPDGTINNPDATRTVHGCPGYSMAMGVLLGMLGVLLKAGTLRPTGSPVLLILTPPPPQ